LVKEKALKRYISIKAAEFIFEVNKLLTALDPPLCLLPIKDVWLTIASHVTPPSFEKDIRIHVPVNFSKMITR
jgi:hypothetical protein